MWACAASLLGQTRRIKPRDADGESQLAKGVAAGGPALQGEQPESWEMERSAQMLKMVQRAAAEAGNSTLGLRTVQEAGRAVSGEEMETAAPAGEQDGQGCSGARRVVGVTNLLMILSCPQQSLFHRNGLIWVSEEHTVSPTS